MMTRFLTISTIVLSTQGCFEVAHAATVTYNFNVTIDNSTTGDLLGNTYSGTTSYDDATLDNTIDQDIPLSSFLFSFEGTDYDLTGDPNAVASFSQGQFLGVSYNTLGLAFLPGFSSINDASFLFADPNSTLQVTGPVDYSLVPNNLKIPEGSMVMGLLSLGLVGLGYKGRDVLKFADGKICKYWTDEEN